MENSKLERIWQYKYKPKAILLDPKTYSSVYLTITLRRIQRFHYGGALILQPPLPPPLKLPFRIPATFLASEESCREHVAGLLSEIEIDGWLRGCLVPKISRDFIKTSGRGKGGPFVVSGDLEVIEHRYDLAAARMSVEEKCAICLEEKKSGAVKVCLKLPCSHVFHRDCVLGWLRRKLTCPMCRAVFSFGPF